MIGWGPPKTATLMRREANSGWIVQVSGPLAPGAEWLARTGNDIYRRTTGISSETAAIRAARLATNAAMLKIV